MTATTGEVGLAIAEALAALGLDIRWIATHPTATGYEAKIRVSDPSKAAPVG